jgi:hypothetical protein
MIPHHEKQQSDSSSLNQLWVLELWVADKSRRQKLNASIDIWTAIASSVI